MSRTDLKKLLELARSVTVSSEDGEEQRRSFACGHAHIENTRVTRRMVDDAADRLAAAERTGDNTTR